MTQRTANSLILFLLSPFFVGHSALADSAFESHWQIQNSSLVEAGSVISKANYNTSSWYAAKIPSTVMGNIVDDLKKSPHFQDPFFGKNIMTFMGTPPFPPLPGDHGTFYAETPSTSPFSDPWWYRREFTLPGSTAGSQVKLVLDGITYGAEVWVNGTQIAGPKDTEGSYRAFDFEIAKYLNAPGTPNVVAVKVWTPEPRALMASWVDWNITPQDKNMGLWRGADLIVHGGVTVNHPQVLSAVSLPAGEKADLTVETEVTNSLDHAVNGTLNGEIGGITFSQPVSLGAGETKLVSFTPDIFSQLKIDHPKLWWPIQMGTPHLYHLKVAFHLAGAVSDQKEIEFGIRSVDSHLNARNSRQFYINGKPLLIRGGGWASDLLLRFSPERVEKEMNYVLDMGLNTIRLEGDMQPDEFYKMADRKGILVMPGLVCCNSWQYDNSTWSKEQRALAAASMKDLILSVRAHPSVFVFLYGSDEAPSDATEAMYMEVFHAYHWPNPVVASATRSDTPLNDISGFKMEGPYDYTAPSYWYTDKTHGGAFGFNTETSPGPSIPTMEGLKKFLPAESLDHVDATWTLHSGENAYNNIDRHTHALEQTYGPIKNMEDMVEKSQVMDYASHRAMFEAFNRNKKVGATGIVQWMLNNAWPTVIWHLYDYYLEPSAAYFGVKEANRPLHLIYGYDNHLISLVNSTYDHYSGLKARVQLYDLDSKLISTQDQTLNIVANDSVPVLTIKTPSNVRGNLFFIRLSLRNESGELLDHNLYWLPTTPETHPLTPGEPEGDLTALNSLPKTTVKITSSWDADEKTETIHLSNPGKTMAFFLSLKLTEGPEQTSLLPVIWSDNDITLMPGEERTLTVRFPNTNVGKVLKRGQAPEVHGVGFNVPAF